MFHSVYDSRANLKYLLGRDANPAQCDVDGVPPAVRDEALAILCDSFDILERQMHCLRGDDELAAIYQSMVGPRLADSMEFERLWMSLDELRGEKVTAEEVETIKTVEDLIRAVARRRGITSQRSRPDLRI